MRISDWSSDGCSADLAGLASVSIGEGASAADQQSTALGAFSYARATDSVAIGSRAVANEYQVVSFGHAAGDAQPGGGTYATDLNRRLSHVAAGVNDTDAVNVAQLNASLAAAGGSPYFAVDDSSDTTAALALGGSTAVGVSSAADGESTAIGFDSVAKGESVAVGHGANAEAPQASGSEVHP